MLMSNDIMRGTSSRFIAGIGKPVPTVAIAMCFLDIVSRHVLEVKHKIVLASPKSIRIVKWSSASEVRSRCVTCLCEAIEAIAEMM